MMDRIMDFYEGKRVFVTGVTGFKGSWLCRILSLAGADVTGYALKPPTQPSLFEIAQIDRGINFVEGDVNDYEHLSKAFAGAKPEIVLHLAAQPLVRESYKDPVYTYRTNVMGTVHILECVRQSNSVKSFLNVTTDKVYKNREWEWGYRENEELDGFDPYSNSKSCSELVTHSYNRSFLRERGIAVSTARAGNVIGGGDFAADRIIPDCVRSVRAGEPIVLRNPASTRPYQHVLEPLFAYLLIAMRQYDNRELAGYYNVGPNDDGCFRTDELVKLFVEYWGKDARWESRPDQGPHEAGFLKLDCSKMKSVFGWRPRWSLDTAVQKTVEWTKCWLNGEDVNLCMKKQIGEFLENENMG